MRQQVNRIAQHRFGVHLNFTFGTDQLTYSIRDFSGEREFSVGYEAIDVLNPSRLVVNSRQFVRGLFFIPLIGIILAVALHDVNRVMATTVTLVSVFAAIGLALARSLKLFAIKYTTLHMSPVPAAAGGHPIRVIKDHSHGAIIGEINARWKARLKQLYGSVNPANEVDKEIAKFSWLKERGVITEAECRDALQTLADINKAGHDQVQISRPTLN